MWTHKDKDHFLDTLLRGYPFPEIYLADGDVNLESGEGKQLLVDGLQRVSTILEYFEASPHLRLLTVPPYRDLQEEAKRAFLQCDVAVRDLGNVHRDEIVEVFRRINATKYSLLDIGVNNAGYAGEPTQFAERLAEDPGFIDNCGLNARDLRRMRDLRYVLTRVITLMRGYFKRDDALAELLERYNDDFPWAAEIERRLRCCFELLTECGFDAKSRIWKKADLFTVIVEMDQRLGIGTATLQPSELLECLTRGYGHMEADGVKSAGISGVYYKAAIQATNDKVNRLRRGYMIAGILRCDSHDTIAAQLRGAGLI